MTNATPKGKLRCTVRGCGEPLACDEHYARCPRGHSFDRARRGYWNLLQPQDRRSLAAGDSAGAAQARRRLAEAGHLQPLFVALAEMLDHAGLAPGSAVLDVGCGEGSLLASVAKPRAWLAHGIDLSRPSIEMAAALWPEATWVIANADRSLPYVDGGFDAILSVTSRLEPREFRRVLRSAGAYLVAVAGEDDLIELRALAQGRGELRPRLAATLGAAEGSFATLLQRTIRWQLELDRAGLDELLASSYRGARRSEGKRLAELESAVVTMSRDVALLRAL